MGKKRTTLPPELMADWADELTVEQALATTGPEGGVGYKARWRHSCGLTWTTRITKRLRGQGCPSCSLQKRQIPPEIVMEWADERGINQVKFKDTTAKWKHSCGYMWATSKTARLNGSGCPLCNRGVLASNPEYQKLIAIVGYPLTQTRDKVTLPCEVCHLPLTVRASAWLYQKHRTHRGKCSRKSNFWRDSEKWQKVQHLYVDSREIAHLTNKDKAQFKADCGCVRYLQIQGVYDRGSVGPCNAHLHWSETWGKPLVSEYAGSQPLLETMADQKLLWKHHCDNTWSATPHNRNPQGNASGCPHCSGQYPTYSRLHTLAPALLDAANKGQLTGAQMWPIVAHLSAGSPGLATALKRLVKDRERNPTASVATLLSQQPDGPDDAVPLDDDTLDTDPVEQILTKHPRRPEDARAAIESIEQQVRAADPTAELHLNQFIVASLCAGYWADYCRHESQGNSEALEALVASLRATDSASLLWGAVATKFITEYDAAVALPVPKGFRPRGKDRRPLVLSMMQRLVAYHMTTRQRFGNWSAPGAGKTIAALYTAALLKSKLTLIVAPLSVIENAWVPQIAQCFPRSSVQGTTQKLTWSPDDETTHLCLNYDRLQSDQVAAAIKKFAAEHGHRVGLIVFDECHRLKNDGKMGQGSAAKRHDAAKLLLEALPHAKLLVQTGTPVLTGVAEGIALLEMIEPGITDARKLQRRNSIAGALDLHTAYTLHGVRFKPDYGVAVEQPIVDTRPGNGGLYACGGPNTYNVVGSLPSAELPTCEMNADEYAALQAAAKPWQSWLAIERVLTPVRIPAIVAACRPRTVVYSHNTGTSSKDSLIDSIAKAISKRFRCAVLDGRNPADRASIIAKYKRGDLDVLVCSSVLGEGVDGLQDVGSRLVINCPPWTDGAYDQLVARWLRTGQKNTVQVVIPLTYYTRPDGLRVSLDVDRLARIGHRASIADAVLDGTIPATFITETALRDRAVALLSDV